MSNVPERAAAEAGQPRSGRSRRGYDIAAYMSKV